MVKFHLIPWHGAALVVTPAIVFESFYGFRNGPDCWKLYFAWGRFEIGIGWEDWDGWCKRLRERERDGFPHPPTNSVSR